MTHDLPPDFNDRMKASFARLDQVLSDCDKLLSRNRVFIDRMAGVGKLPKEEAISYGLTGPLLRATGVSYDVRKAHPYLVYDRMEFEVPVGDRGDNYDRFNVRFQEMYQSKRIIEQAIAAARGNCPARAARRLLLPSMGCYDVHTSVLVATVGGSRPPSPAPFGGRRCPERQRRACRTRAGLCQPPNFVGQTFLSAWVLAGKNACSRKAS